VVQIMNEYLLNGILHLLESRPKQGKRMIGLSAAALWELWQRIQVPVDAAVQARNARPDRQRAAGGGRAKDTVALGRLLVTLLYLRQHWTMQSIAVAIDCREATVFNYIHEMLPYIRQELPASLLEQWQAECTRVEGAELETWLTVLPAGALLVDTWEQPIPMPQDREVQASYYSGKQKMHTRKNQLICLPQGLDIVDVVIGEKGPRSDSKLLAQTQAELPAGMPFIGDKAYVGRTNTTTPIKKPPKGELTQAQKNFNKGVSQVRVYVEHLIRVIKIWRIAKEEFRLRMPMYEMVIGCVCGLVRLREQYA
jgi:DDE superfamily endonuclease/Helix-turn-helix of DDE superfamily endonuclease